MELTTNGITAANGAATNGKGRYQHDKVRVAIIGVGNCANSFVQGVHHYATADAAEQVPGLMHVDLGGYHVSDIEFTCAFDINATKVGKDLGEAIWADPNNTIKFTDKVPSKLGVPVYRGMTHDGIGKYAKEKITKAPGETADIVSILKETHTDVVVSYLPVGSEQATKWYVEQVLEAGCGFVNCIPVFIARERLESKKISKTNAVTSVAGVELPAGDIHVGPSDYVPWLTDRKWAHIRLEGRSFGDVPLNLELKLEVWDSPNSAGVVIDAVRCARLALDRGLGGALEGPSAYFMKSPPVQHRDEVARLMVETFITDNARERVMAP